MSTNPYPVGVPDGLDVNSDAVPREEKHEISTSRVSSESAAAILTLTEPSNSEGLVDGSSRVCSVTEDQVKLLFDSSEEAEAEVLNRQDKSVDGGNEKRGDEFESVDVKNKESEGLEEVPSAQDELVGNGDSRDEKEFVEIGEETERIDEDSSLVEKNQETEIENGGAGDIESHTTFQDKDQDINEESVSIAQFTESQSCEFAEIVEETERMDEDASHVEKNQETEIENGGAGDIESHTTFQDKDQDIKEESVSIAQVTESQSCVLVGHQSTDPNPKLVDENPNAGAFVTIDSNSVAAVTTLNATPPCEEEQSACVSESVGSLKEENFHVLDGSEDQIDEGCVSIPCEMDVEKKIPVTLVSEVDFSLTSENQPSMVVDLSSSFCRDENRTTLDVTESGTDENQKTEVIEPCQDPESQAAPNKADKRTAKRVSLIRNEASAIYYLPKEQDGGLSVSDLVWGKVRSHPWWPGQIFDPSDSSEMAAKLQKKNGLLVAYFGDQTFAWCESSQLRPFRTHFSRMEKQSNSDALLNAVDSAVDEISRRVELGLTCTCIPEEAVAEINCQKIDNTGIREGASSVGGADKVLNATSFEPDRLVEYIKTLALFPPGGFDRVEFMIAQAQLMSFYRSKGCFSLPTFYVYRGLVENDADILPLERKPSKDIDGEKVQSSSISGKGKPKTRSSSSHKERPILEDGLHHSRKQRSLAELMAGKKTAHLVTVGSDIAKKKTSSKSVSQSSIKKVSTSSNKKVSPSSSKKRKATTDSFSEEAEQSKKKRVASSDEVDSESGTPKSSFKVGECIRRVASQLTGSPPILKSGRERFQRNVVKAVDPSRDKPFGINVSPRTHKENQRRIGIPKEFSSPDDLLCQLCLAARDPMKGYSFLFTIISFFSEFRNSICLDLSGSGSEKKHKKSLEEKGGKSKTGSRKSSKSKTSSAETFKFDDMRDSYWTDRVVDNGCPEEKPSQKTHKKKIKSQRQGPTKRPKPETEAEKSPQFSPKHVSEKNPEEQPSQKSRKRKGKSQRQRPTKRRKPATKLEKSLQLSPKHVSDTSSEEKPLQQIRKRLGNSQGQGRPKSPKPAIEPEKPLQLSPKRVSDTSPEEKPAQKSRKQKGKSQRQRPKPATEPEDSLQLSPKHVSDASPDANLESVAEEHVGHLDESCEEECYPTALILSFTEADSVPSESELSKIFSRYGPLKEDETEVLRKTSRARVVFKRKSDAEVAFSSAGKYSIFGPALVSYRLKYLLSAPKASPNATKESRNDATSVEGNDVV